MRDAPAAGDVSRRTFLALGASCAAHLLLLAHTRPAAAAALFARAPHGPIVAQEPWGRIERLADGVWAMVSTPLQDRLTLCNGAIIAGRSRTVVVEAFASREGARWLLAQAERLTGRRVDDVVVTHYHGDHTGGIGEPVAHLHATPTTVALVRAADLKAQRPADPARTGLLLHATPLSTISPTALDLGGRTLRIVPRSGHTASDLTLELDDPSIVIAGDLLWNGMVPNYVDAIPTRLSRSVRDLVRERETRYLPGHGPVADDEALVRYLELLDLIEAAARRAFGRGLTPAQAAREFQLPKPLADWTLFSPVYLERALDAWLRELAPGR